MKTHLFVIAVISVAVLSATASAQTTGPILSVVLSDQNPYPVNPGETVTIGVDIQNTGYNEAADRTIEIMPSDPFTLLPGEDRETTINKISARGTFSKTYRLSVDPDAPTNTYPVEFRIYSGNDRNNYISDSVDVIVEGEPELIIDDLYTMPDDLEPGSLADIVVMIKNIGTGTAHDLKVRLNSSHDELKPILAKGKVFVGDVLAGETVEATLGASIESTAEEKTYNVLIVNEYTDESSLSVSDPITVGLPVRGTINLDIIKKEANFDRGTLRFEVANKGTVEAKSVEAKLVVDGETVDIDYTSSLKANKKTTFEFPLVLHGEGELVINYIGPGIENNRVTKEVSLNYRQPQSGDGLITMIVLIIVLVILYLAYRKFFRKKKR